MKLSTLAYTAGLLDGDGHIGVSRYRKGPYKSMTYCVDINVTNESKPLVNWLVLHFGGVVKKYISTAGNEYFVWCCTGKEARKRFLGSVMPFLIIKKQYAECLLRFLDIEGKQPELRSECWEERSALQQLKSVTTDTQNAFDPTDKLHMAYLAGLVDTDGHISFSQGYWYCGLTNIHKPILMQVKNTFGGSLWSRLRATNRVRCFEWASHGTHGVERFLLAIMPYMIVKRDKALKALGELRSKVMIQSELIGNNESELAGTLAS